MTHGHHCYKVRARQEKLPFLHVAAKFSGQKDSKNRLKKTEKNLPGEKLSGRSLRISSKHL